MPGMVPYRREDPRWKRVIWTWSERGFLRDSYRQKIDELIRVCEAAGQDHPKEQYAYWAYAALWQIEFWENDIGHHVIAPGMSSAEALALPVGPWHFWQPQANGPMRFSGPPAPLR